MDVNGRVFQVRKLLGKGKGGYSYLVSDGEREYVLKQIHHEPCSYYTFGDKLAAELHDYDRLCQAQVPMPRMLDVDRDQERILKEYIPGPTVYDLVKQDALDLIYVTQARELSLSLERKGLNQFFYDGGPANVLKFKDIFVEIGIHNVRKDFLFIPWIVHHVGIKSEQEPIVQLAAFLQQGGVLHQLLGGKAKKIVFEFAASQGLVHGISSNFEF